MCAEWEPSTLSTVNLDQPLHSTQSKLSGVNQGCQVSSLSSKITQGWDCCRALSLDSRSPEAEGDDRRSRRIKTVDYSKPGSEAPFSVPTMSGMAGRSILLT